MSAVMRTVIVDAISIMQEINTVVDGLFEMDDDRFDTVYLPIVAKYFVDMNANVRIYITKENFDNRSQYRNSDILEKLLQIGLLHIIVKSDAHFYWDLLTLAQFHATFIMTNYNYEVYPGIYQNTIRKYVVTFESFRKHNYNLQILKSRLIFQYSLRMYIHLDDLSVEPGHADYQKSISALKIHPNLPNDLYIALDDLLGLMHVMVCEWIFNGIPHYDKV